MKIEDAGIPDNIVWENKSIRGFQKIARYIASAVFVIMMTIITFKVIIILKIKSNTLTSKYVDTNCKHLYDVYSDNEILEVTAFHYINELEVEKGIKKGYSPGVGGVKCFCENPDNEANIGKLFKFEDHHGKEAWEPICDLYLKNNFQALLLSKICSILISLINICIKSGIVCVINRAGMDS